MNSLTSLDLFIIGAYLLLTLGVGFWGGRSSTPETYYANDRTTKLPVLLASTIATWVGAGAIVGVCSAGFSSGISYALSVVLVNTIFMALFAYLAPRIKDYGDQAKAYTAGLFLEKYYGTNVRMIFAVLNLIILLIWAAVQLLAMGQFLSVTFGFSLFFALCVSLLLVLSYTAFGGLRSDIYTDCLQLVVMVLTFTLFIPLLVLRGGGFDSLAALPVRYFDPAAFGGWLFVVASILIGSLYPLVNVYEWQKIFAARSGRVARWSYILAMPCCALFVCSASLVGLFAARHIPQTNPDQAFFSMLKMILPNGALGLAYAGVLALIMSSLDSIFVAATALISHDLRPALAPDKSLQISVRSLRIINLCCGLACGLIAYLMPSVVSLSILATYLSVCFAPSMLAALFNWKLSHRAAQTSILAGVLALALSWPYLGKNCFPIVFVAIFIPVLAPLLKPRKSVVATIQVAESSARIELER